MEILEVVDLDVSQTNGAADLWVIKITPEGTLLWEKTMGGTSFDVGRSISKTQDNGFLILEAPEVPDGNLTFNKGQNDAWVLKIDGWWQLRVAKIHRRK